MFRLSELTGKPSLTDAAKLGAGSAPVREELSLEG